MRLRRPELQYGQPSPPDRRCGTPPHFVPDCTRALDGSGRTVEGCQKSIAGCVDLLATELLKVLANNPMVILENLLPTVIPQFRQSLSGSDDVGEKDGG